MDTKSFIQTKKPYAKPIMLAERFVANEFVAACTNQTITAYYAIPIIDLDFPGGGSVTRDQNGNGVIDPDEPSMGLQTYIQDQFKVTEDGVDYLMIDGQGEPGIIHAWDNSTNPPTEITKTCWMAQALMCPSHMRDPSKHWTEWNWMSGSNSWFTVEMASKVINLTGRS